MTNTIKSIIFDMDGVLVFTDKYHTRAWKALGEKYGFKTPDDIGDMVRGVGRMDALELAISESDMEFDDEQKKEMAEYKNSIFLSFVEDMTPEDVDYKVRFTLGVLKGKGYRLAVGSSSRNTVPILKRIDLLDVFDEVADGTIIERSKPDPQVFLKAAELLGNVPEECAVVEDAKSGIEAAKAGGMTAIAIGDARDSNIKDYELLRFEDLMKVF